MSELKKITTNGEPVEGQAPTPSAEDKTLASTTSADYLSSGFYKGEGAGRYIDPALVDEKSKEIAKALAAGGMKQSAYNPILRELKRANKKTLPLEAKLGALAGAIPQAKQLVQRKRAPGLLVDILERNRREVQDSADYSAAIKHLTAVGVFLGDYQ